MALDGTGSVAIDHRIRELTPIEIKFLNTYNDTVITLKMRPDYNEFTVYKGRRILGKFDNLVNALLCIKNIFNSTK